jgi:cell division protein FtsI (penicillin-binding protein 3)
MTRRTAARDQKRWMRLRLWMVAGGFGLLCLVLAGRAVDLMVLKQDRLAGLARGEFVRQVKLTPRRGIIFDRHMEEMAVSLDTDSVYARPLAVTTPADSGRRLAKALGLGKKAVVAKLKSERRFVWIARRVSPAQAEAVRKLDLTGVGLVKEPRRFYPNSNLACHVLGFAGLDARGLEGLEAAYDKTLKGPDATVTSLRDALGRTVSLDSDVISRLPEGNHLVLTLDKTVQYHTEKILAETVTRYRAAGGMALVMLPQTGEILAMAANPGFNPNVFGRYPKATYRNRLITDTFEPGSTFKIFVAAAALARHAVSLEQTFFCEEGAWQVGRRVLHDVHSHGKLNLADIIKLSSNIGAAKVGQAVGRADLYRTFRDFGFGQPTGIDLNGEVSGVLRPWRSWREIEMATTCFGQGLSVTALQLTQAVAAVANGGVLMRPFLVKAELDRESHLVRETRPRVVRRAMGAREARILTGMMTRVTEDSGTGPKARVEPFQVAGKTGTAQKVKPEGGYSHSDYVSSFVGFLPAEDPRVAVLVAIDSPRGSHYGGVVAGPAFARIARVALNSLGVYRPSAEPLTMAAASQDAPPAPVPTAGALQAASAALEQGITPDMSGLTLRQANDLARRLKLKLTVRGWGRVASQQPAPGSPNQKNALQLVLKPAHGGA